MRMTSPIPPSLLASSSFSSSCCGFQFLTRFSKGCRELSEETVDGRPWARVSWTTGMEEVPVFDLRVEGVPEDEGMNLRPFDYMLALYIRFWVHTMIPLWSLASGSIGDLTDEDAQSPNYRFRFQLERAKPGYIFYDIWCLSTTTKVNLSSRIIFCGGDCRPLL